MDDVILIALIRYELLAGPFLEAKEYLFPKLKNIKVAGIVKNTVPNEEGKVKIQFTDDFGGELDIPKEELEFIVLPRNLFY